MNKSIYLLLHYLCYKGVGIYLILSSDSVISTYWGNNIVHSTNNHTCWCVRCTLSLRSELIIVPCWVEILCHVGLKLETSCHVGLKLETSCHVGLKLCVMLGWNCVSCWVETSCHVGLKLRGMLGWNFVSFWVEISCHVGLKLGVMLRWNFFREHYVSLITETNNILSLR